MLERIIRTPIFFQLPLFALQFAIMSFTLENVSQTPIDQLWKVFLIEWNFSHFAGYHKILLQFDILSWCFVIFHNCQLHCLLFDYNTYNWCNVCWWYSLWHFLVWFANLWSIYCSNNYSSIAGCCWAERFRCCCLFIGSLFNGMKFIQFGHGINWFWWKPFFLFFFPADS